MIDESRYIEEVQEFIRVVNTRLNSSCKDGLWVRVLPPSDADLEAVEKDKLFMPFTRVGSLAIVSKINDNLFDVKVGKDSIIWEKSDFLETFIRVVEGCEWSLFQNIARS
jgi:hypothetical protein